MINITNEDCMELMARYPDGYFDISIIDPPYGTMNCEWDDATNLEKWLAEIYRVPKPNGTLICFGQQPMFSRVVTFMGKRFSHELIWEKTAKGGFANANKLPLRAHENIAVSKVKTAVYYNPEKTILKNDSELGRVRKQKARRYQAIAGIAEDSYYTNDGTRYPDSMLKYETVITVSNHNGGGFFCRCERNESNNSPHPKTSGPLQTPTQAIRPP